MAVAKAAIGYCVKCGKKVPMVNAVLTKTKKGQPMMKGRCAKCGTKVCRFVKKA